MESDCPNGWEPLMKMLIESKHQSKYLKVLFKFIFYINKSVKEQTIELVDIYLTNYIAEY